MIVYPAVDLIGGEVVRLIEGRFDDVTRYSSNPAAALRAFAEAGATWVHIVDLDGARAGEPVQHQLIGRLAKASALKVQAAGGIRSRDHVAALLDAGVERVVIGSLAVKQPDLTAGILAEFGKERITLALDVKLVEGEPMVAVSGWTETSTRTLWAVAESFDACHVLVTDVSRDGKLQGPNFELLAEARRRLPHIELQASGGIAALDDLDRIDAAGVIIGKALWEGRFTLEEAIQRARA